MVPVRPGAGLRGQDYGRLWCGSALMSSDMRIASARDLRSSLHHLQPRVRVRACETLFKTGRDRPDLAVVDRPDSLAMQLVGACMWTEASQHVRARIDRFTRSYTVCSRRQGRHEARGGQSGPYGNVVGSIN